MARAAVTVIPILALCVASGQVQGKNDKVKDKAKIVAVLQAPADGAVYTAPANITLRATASAKQANHPIAKVEFFQGATLIGTVSSPQADDLYSFEWTSVAAGSYSLSARATNDKGDIELSQSVAVVVNAPPTVSITSPASGAVLQTPGAVSLLASAADADGAIAKVEFFQGQTLVGTALASPYTVALADLSPGGYAFIAVATDDRGAAASSAPVAITVNAPPAVSLNSPVNGTTFTAPADIPVSAAATDPDGTITAVEFYSGSMLIATRTSPPYSITWMGVPQGTYSLSVRAIDNAGAAVTAAPASVTVNATVAQLYFIHADHLNTPRLVADAAGTTVWKWEQQEPFGNNVPDENPSGLGAFDLPLRLPGQYYDKETSVNQNFYRDYDPAIGRYEQSDPIGLEAGLNTYSYVLGSPLKHKDFFGLARACGSGRTEPLTPDLFPSCCGDHDDCYDDCVRLPTKGACDDAFLDCMLRRCNSRWVQIRFACIYAASYYYGAVVVLGGSAFDDARSKCKGSHCKR